MQSLSRLKDFTVHNLNMSLSTSAHCATFPPSEKVTMGRHEAAAELHDEIPDGGFRAYLQVFGAFLLFFNSW